MGANFAPSYANLAMDFGENNHIHKNNPFAANIVFFWRYIDDFIIIWDDLITSFVQHCNNNTYGLSVTNPSTIDFLDLELGHNGHRIWAKKYTKPTAGNSYLHFKCCHYPKWTKNIPKANSAASGKIALRILIMFSSVPI